jgi:hypothetical protein
VAELHHDGCVALAIGLGAILRINIPNEVDQFARRVVPYRLVDLTVADAVALAVSHVRNIGGAGPILIRAKLLRDSQEVSPMIAVKYLKGPFALALRVAESRPVRRPIAVEAQLSADDDIESLRGAARQLADDLGHQFGLRGSTIPE